MQNINLSAVEYDFPKRTTIPTWYNNVGFNILINHLTTDKKLTKTTLANGLANVNTNGSNTLILKSRDTRRLTVFKIIKLIGAGAIGTVHDIEIQSWLQNGKAAILPTAKYVIKIITSDGPAERDIFIEGIMHVLASHELSANEIPKFHNIMYNKYNQNTYIVMQKLQGGELLSRILSQSKNPTAASSIIKTTIEGIAKILTKLHKSLQFIHSDLHPGNIYVRPDGTVALLDFGLASGVIPNSSHRIGKQNAFITHFHPGIDIAFLAFTICYEYSSKLTADCKNYLRHLCTTVDDNCLLDRREFRKIDTWEPVLKKLNNLNPLNSTPSAIRHAVNQ